MGGMKLSNKAKIISTTLIIASLICGIFMLYYGISGTLKLNKVSKNYETTEGYLLDYSLYSEGKYDIARKKQTSDTYRLIYNYTVDGQEYTVSTDFGTSFIPKVGSTKEIKYNPNNPEEAMIVGPNKNIGLIFIGVLFISVPLFIMFGMLSSMGYLQKVSDDTVGMAIGFYFVVVGYGAIYMIIGEYSIKRIFKFFSSSFTLPLLIPILLIVVGIYLFIKSLLFSKKANTKKKSKKR